jgi:hypothetical protein
MKKPLYDGTLRFIEDLMISRARVVDQSPQEIIAFAWGIGEAYELKVQENITNWSLWANEQFRLAERNRLIVRAEQTHCVYCEQALDGTSHLDHIEAVKNGGSGEITNLVYACAKCNLSKNGQDFWRFIEAKTKSVKSQIIRRLDKLGKQIPLDIRLFSEPPADA